MAGRPAGRRGPGDDGRVVAGDGGHAGPGRGAAVIRPAAQPRGVPVRDRNRPPAVEALRLARRGRR